MERTRTYERSSNEDARRKTIQTSDFGPKKTIIVLAIVAGCFAVLWPKLFYPMLTGSTNTGHTATDGSVCCDLIFESDVNTVDILQEMCNNIMKHHKIDPRVRDALTTNKLTPQTITFCRDEVLARCGIDLSSFLAEKERLGKSHKQVIEEIRSFNSSLCLRNNFGVSLAQLGIPHLIRYHILMPHIPLRQERRLPPHAGGLHPAMRERGRAIPTSHIVPRVDGRPEHIVPKMRPPMGGPGRVVPPPSGGGGGGTMGIILPLYTVGILVFFLYTIAKILKKNSNNEIYQDYRNPEAEREFRDRVFNPEILTSAITGTHYYRKERSPSPKKPVPTIEELQALNGTANSNGPAGLILELKGEFMDKQCCKNHDGIEDDTATMKVLGMEMTASSEDGQKISRPTTPIFPDLQSHQEREKTPPKPIYLEGTLPSQCEILVSDSETQEESSEENSESAVVLSSKVTLSLISHDYNSPDSTETMENSEQKPVNSSEVKSEMKENGEIRGEVINDNEKVDIIRDVRNEEKFEGTKEERLDDEKKNLALISDSANNDEEENNEKCERKEIEGVNAAEEDDEEEDDDEEEEDDENKDTEVIEQEEEEEEEEEEEDEEDDEEDEHINIDTKKFTSDKYKNNEELVGTNENEESDEEEDEEEEDGDIEDNSEEDAPKSKR